MHHSMMMHVLVAFANKPVPAHPHCCCCCCTLRCVVQGGSIEQHRDVLERPCAAAALAGLLHFSAITSDSSGLGKHQLALYDPGRYVGTVGRVCL